MADSSFFALLDRTKYIARWGLMRSSIPENVQEHSMQVSVLAHALATIGRDLFGKAIDPSEIAAAALYHDCSEIFTGDLPTPVKYKNDRLSGAYKDAELDAKERLFAMLPEELQAGFADVIFFEERQPERYRYIKAADKLSAYIKCLNELSGGNGEFKKAAATLRATLDTLAAEMDELRYFMEHFIEGYGLTVDEL
ncbi:MAG: 5'-deoxynucleotidase [Clostridia bacterium]|nr:5'-deoxynucleotidase [Clostridia bacterium]MBR7136766.1 5'-deoxynucleotidase [Clostridia bacterium]